MKLSKNTMCKFACKYVDFTADLTPCPWMFPLRVPELAEEAGRARIRGRLGRRLGCRTILERGRVEARLDQLSGVPAEVQLDHVAVLGVVDLRQVQPRGNLVELKIFPNDLTVPSCSSERCAHNLPAYGLAVPPNELSRGAMCQALLSEVW